MGASGGHMCHWTFLVYKYFFSILGIGEEVQVAIASPPVDGKANTELVRYLADICGIKKSQVALTKVC